MMVRTIMTMKKTKQLAMRRRVQINVSYKAKVLEEKRRENLQDWIEFSPHTGFVIYQLRIV